MAKWRPPVAAVVPSDQPVFWGLLGLLLWCPLPLGSNRTWAIGILLLAVLALTVLAVFAWRNYLPRALAQLERFTLPLVLLLCLVAYSWFQTLPMPAAWINQLSPAAAVAQSPAPWMTLSLDVNQSRIMAALAFVYFMAFAITVLTVRDAQRLDTLAQVLVWSAVLQTVIGALLYSIKATYRIFFVPISHVDMVGTFVNRNHMAGYLCMCLSVGIGLMLSRLHTPRRHGDHWKSKVRGAIEFVLSPKMRLRILLVVIVIGLVLTRSRMGNSAFFSALLVVGLVGIVLMRRTAPQTMMLVASLVVIDVLVVGTWVGLERVVERIQGTEVLTADGGTSESVEARTEAARTALPIVRDYPWFGTGGGSFYNVFLGYRTPQYGYQYVDHTHNDYVEFTTDFGFIGLALLGTFVVSTLVIVLRVLSKRQSRLPRGIAFGVTMAMVALMLHSTVDFNLQIPSNALTMVVILAMGWVASRLPSPEPDC